jgi:hypothetical protein
MAENTFLEGRMLDTTALADPCDRAVQGVSLRPLDFWDRGFEFSWGHGFLSLVFVVCCVGNDLCDELITRSEESCRVCLIAWVI